MRSEQDPFAQHLAAGRPVRVGILLFSVVEVLDFAGPFEVFSVAARVARHSLDGAPTTFEVATVAARKALVTARHGLVVEPAHGFEDAPPFDLFVVPGGIVTQPMGDDRTLAYIRSASDRATLTASVCTGAFLLAKIGLLDGKRATTHWEDIADLRAAFPAVSVIDDVPFVDEGDIVTSAGISAGIGMSLHLVGRILGPDMARRTARQMQYDWEPD